MAFSDYTTLAQVQTHFAITYREENYIIAQEVAVPPQFVQEFVFNRENMDVYTSEASRCEAIIFPILVRVAQRL